MKKKKFGKKFTTEVTRTPIAIFVGTPDPETSKTEESWFSRLPHQTVGVHNLWEVTVREGTDWGMWSLKPDEESRRRDPGTRTWVLNS